MGPHQSHDIGWAEAVAVELGLLLAIHSGTLFRLPSRPTRILVRSDNSGIVALVNKGRSRNRPTNEVLKSIYRMLADLGLSLHTSHVASEDNISDPLSRGDIAAFLARFPEASHQVPVPIPSHLYSCITPL